MTTLYHKFLTRLRQINHHMRPGETALEAMARNMVEIVGVEFAELSTTITQSIAAKLDTPPTAQDGHTPALCEIVKLANAEAGRAESTTIEAHHLLIAIAQEGTSIQAKFIKEYLNIHDIQRLSNYAYSDWHPFRDPSLASAKDIFAKAHNLADQDPVDTHRLFTALITIGNIQPNEICGLLSYLSHATPTQRKANRRNNQDEWRVATSDLIPTVYKVYINTIR